MGHGERAMSRMFFANGLRRSHLAAALFVAVLVSALLVPAPVLAFGEFPLVSSTDLYEHPERWDGKTVCIEGEAIGSVMVRGDQAWIHVNDDSYANDGLESGELTGYNAGIPIVIATAQTVPVESVGANGRRGDFVSVVGRFEAASVDYGGEMLMIGESLSVIAPGGPIESDVPHWKFAAACALAVVTLALLGLQRRERA